MKKTSLYILLYGLLLLQTSLFAQVSDASLTPTGSIKGVVSDSFSGLPVGYVSISLQRKNFNKILNGAITDEKGTFKIEGIRPGTYRLRLVFIGYENKLIDDIVISNEQLNIQLPDLQISPGASLLREVEISANKSLIEQKIDRLIYNVDRDKSAANQTLNELMRKVPMVQVDAEGNISLRGSRNIQVLINGKPSGVFAANMADALRSIPADQVARVEVITMPSARYDAEGTAGIINIITKKKQIEGYNGSLNAAGSNIHNNASANLNVRTAKMGCNTMLGLNGMVPQHITNHLIRTTQTSTESSLLTQRGAAMADRIAATAQIGLDYDPNSQHSFSTNLRWSTTEISADGIIQIEQQNAALSPNYLQRDILSTRNDYNVEWSADYRRSFKNPQNQWTSSAQWSHFGNSLDYLFYERTPGTLDISLGEDALNLAGTDEITAQSDYSCTLKKNIQVETGVKQILRLIGSDANFATWQTDRSDFIPNPERNQLLDYRQGISAAYLEMRFQPGKKWSARIGNRTELTSNTIRQANNPAAKDHYLSWSPSTAITYTFKNTATLTGSFNRRIQRPGIAQLNPFANAADRLNIVVGNIQLRPEMTNIADLSFAMPFKKGYLNGSAYYYHTKDIIERLTTTDADGIATSIQQNIGASQLVGGNAYLTYQLNTVWTLRGGGNASYLLTGKTLNINGVGNRGLQFNGFLMTSLEFKNGLAIQTLGAYVMPQLSVQGRGREFYTLQTTIRKEVMKKKGAISLVIVNPFRRDVIYGTTFEGPGFVQSKDTYMPYRMVSAGFNYRFGKAGALKAMAKKKSVKNTDVKEAEKGEW